MMRPIGQHRHYHHGTRVGDDLAGGAHAGGLEHLVAAHSEDRALVQDFAAQDFAGRLIGLISRLACSISLAA